MCDCDDIIYARCEVHDREYDVEDSRECRLCKGLCLSCLGKPDKATGDDNVCDSCRRLDARKKPDPMIGVVREMMSGDSVLGALDRGSEFMRMIEDER